MKLIDLRAEYPEENINTWKYEYITSETRIYYKPNTYEEKDCGFFL